MVKVEKESGVMEHVYNVGRKYTMGSQYGKSTRLGKKALLILYPQIYDPQYSNVAM